jgi:transposase
VLLLSQQRLVANLEAATQVQLHACSVQRWRRRWAQRDFSLDDKPGRGRKADVSPAGPCAGQGGRL